MKNIAISILLILFISCKPTNDHKVEKSIKLYLSKSLNDADSYEPIDYGSIDSVYSNIDDLAINSAKMPFEEAKNFYNSANTISRSSNDNTLKGFMVTHSYRSTNPTGGKVLIRSIFFLNKDLSKVEFAKHDF